MFVKRCSGRVGRKQAEDAEMRSCLPNDRVHQQGRAAFPAMCLADVQMADPAGSPIFDIGVDVETDYPRNKQHISMSVKMQRPDFCPGESKN